MTFWTYNEAGETYDDVESSYEGFGVAPTRPRYTILIRELDTAAGYAPGDLVAAIDKFHFLAYAEYVNDVGEAFFTIAQKDPKAELLRSIVENGAIMQVLRDGALVWSGWLSETDEGPMDAIFYAYNYASGLFKLHTDWAAEWTNQNLSTIVSECWDRAQDLTKSRMAWMTTGTIETPVTTSGGSTAYVQALYQAYHKRILFVMKEIAAAAQSDTTNRVVFEITPHGEFNFWKNRGELLTNEKWIWGDPRIMSFRRFRRPIDHANVLIGVGDTPRSVVSRKTEEDTTDRDAVGRLEETIYFPWVRDETELERVTKLRLARALRIDADLGLTFAPRSFVPFRAPGQSYKLTDTVEVTIDHGSTFINAEEKMILGQQVLVYRGEEIVRPLLGDRL